MPPQKNVLSLKNFSQDKVLYNVCEIIIRDIYFNDDNYLDCLDDEPIVLTTCLQIARDVFANALSPDLLEDILNTILEKEENIEVSVRYIALRLLLIKGVTYLKVGHFPEIYYSRILGAITESCADLQKLDLRGLWVREKDKFEFCKLIRRLHKIRHLTLKYVCDDEILSIIGKHCKNIEILDISGSNNITEAGIESFVNNPSSTILRYTSVISAALQIINIGGPGAQNLPATIGVTLLLNFPNLKSLGSFERTGQSLEQIYKNYPTKLLGLRYIHDMGTNSQRLSAIIKTCPDIQAIYLDTPGSKVVQHLHMLKNLSEIKLHKVKWDDVRICLQNCGSRIRSIFLLNVWGTLNFAELGTWCPHLIRIELHFVSVSCLENSSTESFKRIIELHVFNSQITTNCMKYILNQFTSIQILSIGDCSQLTDAALITTLYDSSLNSVKSIWFGLAENLTMRTINALIEHCPLLTDLGNLAGWDVGEDEIEFLRIQLMLNNVDLNLHDYGPQDQTFDLL